MSASQDTPLQAAVPTGPAYEAFPREALDGSVVDRFEAIVQRFPDHLAVQDGDEQLSYDQLNRLANRLAHAILQQLGAGSEPVGLLLKHGIQAIVSIMATLKAGKIYLPLDPGEPDERLSGRLADAGVRLVLSDQDLTGRLERLSSNPLTGIIVHELDSRLSEANPSLKIMAGDGFNLMYTSGSSGQPKGVLQIHRNVLHLASLVTDIQKDSPDDRFSLIIPITFGASAADIFGALLCGASLHLFDIKSKGIQRLAGWLARQGITIYHSVPTVFRQLLNTLEQPGSLPRLRCIKLGGEPVVKQDIDRLRQHFSPQCVLQHALGTTETYLSACWMLDAHTPVNESVVPIGYATAGTQILLWDEHRQPVLPGEIGQIAIRSRYISPGYWNKPELTREVLLPDPEDEQVRIYLSGDLGRLNQDGLLEYLGRQDDMIKIHGQRVEPAEIEMALREVEGISEAAVVPFTSPDGQVRLAAYLVSDMQPLPESSVIRRQLANKLPVWMHPAAIIRLDRLPLLPFGKVNRNALPPPAWGMTTSKPPNLPPETKTQIVLAKLFSEVLKVGSSRETADAGLLDNYFELGGDSLSAVDLNLRIEEAFGIHLTLQSLVDHPTLVELARLIDILLAGETAGQPGIKEDDLQHSLRLLGY